MTISENAKKTTERLEKFMDKHIYPNKNTYHKQVCIMPFRRNTLINFNNLQETKLEKIESVDMLRFIENNIKVHMVLVNEETYSVDTPKDLKLVNFKMKNNKLLKTYIKKAIIN